MWVVAFAITLGEILVDPSTVALVPTLVDDVDLERANGRIAGVEIVTNDFAGAPLGAALYAFAPWLPFLVDACSYLGSLLPFRRLPRQTHTAPTSNPAARLRTDAADGFRWLRRHRVLAPFTASQVIYYFGFSAGFSLLVVLVTEELDGSAVAFGVVLSIGAGGAFLGSLAGARVSSAIGTRATLSGCVALPAGALASATDIRWSFAAGGVIQVAGAMVMWRALARLEE